MASEGAHFSPFQVLVETSGTVYTFAFVLHCLSRKPSSEAHISFFLFKHTLITCYMQNGFSLDRIFPKTTLIKQQLLLMPLGLVSHQGSFVRAGRTWGSLLSGAGTLLWVCVCTALSLGTRECYILRLQMARGCFYSALCSYSCSLGYSLTLAWGGGKASFPEVGTARQSAAVSGLQVTS